MSINVTVHGNPISIKKGKMVRHERDSEFHNRRRIRLQQVREQSKEIAADVRNRVRKEKERHLSEAEQKGEHDLKRWQARKLLALQQQYQDCLDEVGTAHTKAALEPNPNQVLNEQFEKNQAEANVREKRAREKYRKESTSKRLELEKPIELKKQARLIEDERSAMITNLNPNKKKIKRKKISTDIDIKNKLVTESDTSENEENVSSNIIKTKKKQKINTDHPSPDKHQISESSPGSSSSSFSLNKSRTSSRDNKKINVSSSYLTSNSSPNSTLNSSQISTPSSSPKKGKKSAATKKFTKIANRIQKRKAFLKETDAPSKKSEETNITSKTSEETNITSKKSEKTNTSSKRTDERDSSNKRSDETIGKKNDETIGKKGDETDNKLQIQSNKIVDIRGKTDPKKLPHVPTTTLRPDEGNGLNEQLNKVKYYDHINHYHKKYTTPPVVQRISKDSIEVHPPSDRSESCEIKQVNTIRDKIAHERGARAIERELMQRNYDQLMKELPLLQKQERLSQLRTHNPAFHMPADRLEELEKRRQSKIENIFEKYYHKSKMLETPIITIRPVQKSPPHDELKLPFRALDITEPNLQINVGEWTSENDPQVIETEDQDEDQLADRQKALIDLLQRVNKQRELLLQEVSTLPPCSNLRRILKEDEMVNIVCPGRLEEPNKEVSCETSPVCKSSKTKRTKIPTKSKKDASVNTCLPTCSEYTSTDATTDVKSKNKKKKIKKRKSLNKHEETQTCPMLKVSPTERSIDVQEIKKPNQISDCNIASSSAFCKYHYNEVFLEPPNLGTCKCDEECMKKSTCACLETYKEHLMKTGIAEKCPCIEKHKEDKERSNEYCVTKQATVKNPYIEKYDNVQKLCEIVIKTSKQADVQVQKDAEKPTSRRVVLNVSQPSKICINSPTNGNDQSSCTTYMSLPKNQQKQTLPDSQKTRQQYKDSLHHKPKQTNVMSPVSTDPNRKEITPNLLKYIQKLLSMSRQSIDELTVSSISDVSTPGNSMVENGENNPFVKLQNVMNYYNLSMNDIKMHLSASDGSTESLERERKVVFVQDNRSGAGTSKDHIDANTDDREPDACSSICIVPQNPKSPQQSPPVRSPRKYEEVAEIAKETFGLKADDMKEIPYANIVSKYKDLTKTCCDRITKLTKMIDNVRFEKERMLSPNVSDRYDTSVTSYLDLPKFTDSHRSNGSSSSSMSQGAVDTYLLAIETDSAKNIYLTRKQQSPPSSRKSSPKNPNTFPVSVSARTTSPPSQTKEMESSSDQRNIRSPLNIKNTDDVVPVSDNQTDNNNEEPFVPMLQGIPKYSPPEDHAYNYLNSPIKQFLLNAAKSKPPPALLRSVTKFNIDMTPHELSTIAEMDTVASSKTVSDAALIRPRTPDDIIPSRDDSESSGSGFMTFVPDQKECVPCGLPRKSSLKQSSKSSRSTSPERPASDLSGIQPINSERSTSPEDMELMLRSMGLAWAITTLKKTHEALALSSSTSSVEASFRKRVSFKETSSSSSTQSDVSLKDVLNKELMKKISSSTLISNTSGLSPNLQELQDLSEIRDPTIFNRDGSQHRTSTPVMHSKSTDSKKDLFTGDSDISSVRYHSEEFFLSLPTVSLDTNKSLSKSKE